jgi:phenylacetyl-CoA:acceptor oxidoreductase subunit 1
VTRYVMVADLGRCIGCQTCTAACKQANGTPPNVEWRRVLDIESGVYPDVRRTFVPVSCMHCGNPPCLDVCPSRATFKRDDGRVAIDYELCIGCAYCAVACPYQQRFKVQRATFAYGDEPSPAEAAAFDPARIGVSTKCTFCSERLDLARITGQTPGVDPEVTPACVNSCIAGALHFGDRDDPESNVSKLIESNEHFRMHEELGTDPGFYYLVAGRP